MRGNLIQDIEVVINIDKFMDFLNEQIKSAIKSSGEISDCEIADWDMDGIVLRSYGRYETGCSITRFSATDYEPADINVERDCEYVSNETFGNLLKELLPEPLRDLLTVTVHEGDSEYEID